MPNIKNSRRSDICMLLKFKDTHMPKEPLRRAENSWLWGSEKGSGRESKIR